jgi:tRNA-dihydrouridine synthase
MIGRASIGYPWIFREIKHYHATGTVLPPPTLSERIATVKKHLTHAIAWKGERLGILEMRRHYANYLRGIANSKTHRLRLVEALSYTEVSALLDEIDGQDQTTSPTEEQLQCGTVL